jgi:cobalamin biosynthetic protein CobC
MKHGGDLTEAMAQHGGTPDDWLDLSTGINPRPWPVPVLPDALWQRLPSRADETRLLDAARAAYNVPADVEIAVAPGTQMLIQWLPRLAPEGAVAIVSPTYNEHAAAWNVAGREVIAVATLNVIPERARHVVIVNPNNPDGRLIERERILALAATLHAKGGLLVVDEAFMDVGSQSIAGDVGQGGIVVLRSFGKFFGLAGVRLGFALADSATVARLKTQFGPWAVSGPALEYGIRALGDLDWQAKMRSRLTAEAARLDALFARFAVPVAGGTSLYRYIEHADAAGLFATLGRRGILLRHYDERPNVLRAGLPGNEEEWARLEAALADWQSQHAEGMRP